MTEQKSISVSKKKDRPFDPNIDAENYNLIARKAVLDTLQLIDSDFAIKPSFFSERDGLNLSQSNEVINVNYNSAMKYCIGFFRFKLTAKHSRKVVLACRCDFMVVYDLPEESKENEALAFCSKVGLFAAYPYFRAFVAHVSSLANAELPPLPIISTGPLKRTKAARE